MGLVRRSARSAAVALLALGLSACGSPYLTQNPSDMLVRVGDDKIMQAAAPSADVMLDYALLADQGYADVNYERGAGPFAIGDGTYCEGRERPGADCVDRAGLTDYARSRLRRWRRIYAGLDAPEFRCLSGEACGDHVGGLGVQVWVRTGRVCSEAAIVFRGTDGGSADDWLSNLRWLLRLLPLDDQYDQVGRTAPTFVETIAREPCFRRGRTRITAIGHSLGGGLAQRAAYQDGRIRAVTAFDPSFVTGASDVPPADLAARTRDLAIERIYEHGEILAYPRWALRQLAPYSTCDPRIRTIRLNTIRGNPVEQHSLNSMATALLGWSLTEKRAGRRTDREPEPSPPLGCGPAGPPALRVL